MILVNYYVRYFIANNGMDCAETMNFLSTSLSGLHLLKGWQSHWHSSGLPGPPSYLTAMDLSTHLSRLMPALCSFVYFYPLLSSTDHFNHVLSLLKFFFHKQTSVMTTASPRQTGPFKVTTLRVTLLHQIWTKIQTMKKKSQKWETFLNMNYIPKSAHNKCYHIFCI